MSIISVRTNRKIVDNPHFWAITVITSGLIFIYQAWPWRDWNLADGVWQWFPWLSGLYNLAIVEFANYIIGVLFFIPIAYAAVIFWWRGALAVWLLSLVAVLPITVGMWSIRLITNISLLLLPVLVILVVAFEAAWRRKERSIFAERAIERQAYFAKILEAQENERQRFAHELHDDVIQTLLVIANRAQASIPSGDDDIRRVKSNVEWLRDATLQAVEDARRISLDLRPIILDNLGLVPALRWLVDRMNKESDVNTQVFINGVERTLSPQVEITVFRIVQEALTNIKRHSKATEAAITLRFITECLKIVIEDNGQGFRAPKKIDKLAAKGKLGLIGMQQEINLIGGKFQIHSRLGEGTRLLIEAKYQHE